MEVSEGIRESGGEEGRGEGESERGRRGRARK